MSSFFQFKIILYLFVLVVDVLLGIIIFKKDKKSATNICFGILSAATFVWLSSLLIEEFSIVYGFYSHWMPRINIFLSVPHAVSFFLFALVFPKREFSISKYKLRLILAASTAMMILNLTPYVFKDSGVTDGRLIMVNGPAVALFGIFVGFFAAATAYILIKKTMAADGVERKQLKMVSYACVVCLLLIIATIVIPNVIFARADFVFLSPFYFLIYLIFTAVAILKYQLFNVKLLITEAVAVLIPILLFVQFFIFDFKPQIVNDILSWINFRSVEIYFDSATFLLSGYLGFIVLLKNYRSWTNRLFFFLSILINFYIVINFLSLHPPGGAGESQLFWIRIVMLVCSFIGPALLLLAFNFPSERFVVKTKHLLPILFLTFASAVASVLPWVFKGIAYPGGEPLPAAGWGMPIFLLDFVGMFIVSFLILVKKYLKSMGEAKKQVWYLMAGGIITFSFMAITTVISVVFFKTSATVFLGPISAILLMAMTAYGIIKHHVFNIKILAIEFFAAVITVALITEGIVSGSIGQSIFKIFFAGVIGFLGIFLVRSVRREIDQEKRLARAVALEDSNRQLLELDHQKTEFLTIAAHQLRTPVSIINNYIGMLQDGDYGQMPGEAKQVLENMDQSNQWLVRLADEFVNIAKLEQGQTKFHFSKINIVELIQEVIDELATKAAIAGLQLKFNSPIEQLFAEVDEEKLKHVLLNFMDNAIKYGRVEGSEREGAAERALPGGEVEVKIKNEIKKLPARLASESVAGRGNKEIHGFAIRVVDHGIGFDKDDEQRLFQKFSRGKNAKGLHVNLSTGLGLYIAKKFVEGHNGEVWAKSEGPGQGSEFGIWLPLNR